MHNLEATSDSDKDNNFLLSKNIFPILQVCADLRQGFRLTSFAIECI
ncbi:MAG: hypothetical protein VW700_04185 [Gammaproteobacteria bacterium]